PTLGEGLLTPSAFNAWEHGCKQHFRKRAIKDADKVVEASDGFVNERVLDWYLTESARLENLSWENFVKEIRERFLPRGWAVTLRSSIFALRQGPDQRFEDFVLQAESINARLQGNAHRLSEDALRGVLGSNMDDHLTLACDTDAISSIASYSDWKIAVCAADAQRILVRKTARSAHAAAYKSTVTGPNKPATQSATSSANGAATKGTKPRVHPPKLKPEERKLLEDHQGCFSCRQFYVDHLARDCPSQPPDPATYKPLTTPMAVAAKSQKELRGKGKAVAAVVDDDLDVNDNAIAAIMSSPIAAMTGVLGTGSESDECVTPLYAPHTILTANLLSPNTDALLGRLLVDSGSHAVLIREDIVDRLQLPQRDLPEPFRLGNAWGTGIEESKKWVKLRIALSDFSWTSVTVRAIVVPHLCAPVLLGKPFLESNHLVEDYAARTLVHKSSGRNLLSPPSPKPPPHTTRIRRLHSDWNTVDCTSVAAAAVRERVEVLALLQQLEAENTAMKQEYLDRFPDDILHINNLPTDCYHRFVLKDANMVISRRQYDCPKKYRESWK
ncbi:hypothetical protein K466DRAFT_446136, partial [Polyporus arcularius HHB13444]